MQNSRDIVVVGSGPSGLACAVEAKKAGLSCVILEKGSLVDYIRRFPTNLTWFSTPELLEIGGVPFAISTVRPTRVDTLNYYRRVAESHGLDIRPFDAVAAVDREPEGFLVTTSKGVRYGARYVIVATGYFDNPNRLGVPGEDLPSVSHYYTEPFAFPGLEVLVVGGRNSAVEAALDLYRHGAKVTLVHRGEALSPGVKYWILPDIENRVKAGEITALFSSAVVEFRERNVLVRTPGGVRNVPAHHTFVLVGFGPDAPQLRRFGITLDPESLAPRADPETLETDVAGLFVAGSVVSGRDTNRIFVENGRLHGEKILRAIRTRSAGAA